MKKNNNNHYKRGLTKAKVSMAIELARKMELTKEDIDKLKIAMMLYDIGKLMIPEEILNKKEPLTDEEKQQCSDEAKAYMEEIGPAIAKDFALNEDGVRIMKEKQALSTKVYNAALEKIAETAEDTSDEGLAKAFEAAYETWKSEATVTKDPIWDNIMIGSVG